MTPDEIDVLFERLRNGIELTDAELKKLQESLGGWKAFTAVAQTALKKGTADTGKSLSRFAMDVNNNTKGFSQLNPIIDSVSGAMGEMAKAIPVLGNVLAGTLKLLAEGSKFTLAEIDKVANAFTDLSKVGAITSKGMSGLQEQFLVTGLTLDSFKKSVIENANAMAAFRGTTAKGAEDFSKIVGSLLNEKGEFKKLGTELKKLGMTPDIIGDAAADFIKVQAQLGLAQRQDYRQLALGMHEYAKEMDEVTRLTGMNAKEQRAARDEALRDSQFRAKIDMMLASGDERQIAAARKLEMANSALVKEAPDLAKALRSMASGFTGITEESSQAFNATGGAMQQLVEQLSQGQITEVVDFMNQLKTAVGQNIGQVQANALAVGDANSAYTKYYQLSNFYNKQWVNSQGEVRAEQRGAIDTQDELTNNVIKAQEELQEMNRRVTNFAFKAMPYASAAVNEFTETINSFVKKFGEKAGINMPELGGGSERTRDKEKTASVVKQASAWSIALGGIITALGAAASATGFGAAAGIPMMTAGAGLMGAGATGAIVGDATGFAEGGISTGPASGHTELLHGTEAVVPLSGGRSIPVTIKNPDPQASSSGVVQQLKAFNTVLPPATKAMLGFNEALNKFTDTMAAAISDEKPKDESLITKAVDSTINFVQNIVKGLFGDSPTGGGARYTGGGGGYGGGGGTGSVVPGGPRGPVSGSLYEQTQDAINKGVRYGFGSKDVASGKIDCSGWVASINTNMMESINKEAGKEIYGKQARQAMQGSAADIIKNVAAATGQMMTGEDVNLQNLQEGMTIGMDTGEHGWDKGRFEGIDHIVQVIKDAEGKLKVSESTGTNEKGGVKMTDLAEWLDNAKKSGAKLFATDPTKMAQGAGTGYDTGSGGAAFGNPAAGRRGASTDMSTYMKTVAMLESGGDPNARAKTSSGGGLFGFLKGSYEDVTGRKGMGEERFDPQKSAEAMKILTMQNKATMEKNLGRQVSGEDLYMGHFLGAGGATKFLQQKDQNPNASAAEAMPAEAAANQSIYYKQGGQARTMSEVYDLMTSKYRKQQEAVMSGQNLPSLVAGLSMDGPMLAGGSPLGSGRYTPGGYNVASTAAPLSGSPTAQSADLTSVIATLQASNESTQSTIRTSMTDMTSQFRDIMSNSQTPGSDSTQLATLLQQIVDGQRDQITVMNRLLQVNQA